MILLIDNYDSFVHNLARYLRRLGKETVVVRNDAIDLQQIRKLNPEAIVLSPGPCTPSEAGCSLAVVREMYQELPILGVCLGHQTIAAALGGAIVRCDPMHGRVSEITHDNQGIFQDLPNPLQVCRYHSLAVDRKSLPAELEISASTGDEIIMAFRHRRLPVVGVQFHPEAILTSCGMEMLSAFLQIAGIEHDRSNLSKSSEISAKSVAQPHLPRDDQQHPDVPVTF